MKKILILSERLPFPPTSGTKNLLFNYCRLLHNELGMEIINVSFLEQGDEPENKPDFISRTYALPNPSGRQKLKNLLLKTVIQRKYPIQVSLFWDPKIKLQIDRIVKKEKPDYVIADFIRTTEYLKDFNGYKIADLQDLLSLRYERQLKVDIHTMNPYGAYLFRFPSFAQKILQLAFVKKAVMKTEIRLLRKFEKNVGMQYDRVMFVAKNEGKIFDSIVKKKKSLIAPLGVDYDFFAQELTAKKLPHSIAFMGALNVAHNENGILHFICNIFPKVLEKIPDAKLYIIGGGATEAIQKKASDSIVLTGRVEDVRTAVEACQIFICPLQFGSGIKTKNLEAMAMGMPVVTTTIGAENINAVNGQDWLVSDADSDFSGNVIKLLEDDNLCEKLGRNAQHFVKENFTWQLARDAFSQLFASLEKET